jgi:hypothetical protein
MVKECLQKKYPMEQTPCFQEVGVPCSSPTCRVAESVSRVEALWRNRQFYRENPEREALLQQSLEAFMRDAFHFQCCHSMFTFGHNDEWKKRVRAKI